MQRLLQSEERVLDSTGSLLPVLLCTWEEPAVVLARRYGRHGLWYTPFAGLYTSRSFILAQREYVQTRMPYVQEAPAHSEAREGSDASTAYQRSGLKHHS